MSKIKTKNLIYSVFQSNQPPFFPPTENRIDFFNWDLLFIHAWLSWCSLMDEPSWKSHINLREFKYHYCWKGQAFRLCVEMLWAESFQKESWFYYRKQHMILPHFHCAQFWLHHILILALYLAHSSSTGCLKTGHGREKSLTWAPFLIYNQKQKPF